MVKHLSTINNFCKCESLSESQESKNKNSFSKVQEYWIDEMDREWKLFHDEDMKI